MVRLVSSQHRPPTQRDTPSPKGGSRLPSWLWLIAFALAALPGLSVMFRAWGSADYTTHGPLIVLVAGALAYARRAQLARSKRDSATWAPWAACAGIAVYLFSLGVGSQAGIALGLVATIVSVVALRGGRPWLSILRFPLVYLLFAVPLPQSLLRPAILKLQLFVTQISSEITHWIGIPSLRRGNVIELPAGPLFVSEACSGVTSVVTMLPIAILLLHLRGAKDWRRWAALVAAVIPIALFWNTVRVVATVLGAHSVGIEAATESLVHESSGLATFAAGCLTIVATDSILRTRCR